MRARKRRATDHRRVLAGEQVSQREGVEEDSTPRPACGLGSRRAAVPAAAGRDPAAAAHNRKARPRGERLDAGPHDYWPVRALHGAELLALGYSVDQVVHGYGDVCQAITALAVEREYEISTDDFRILNRCLDDAIADAVTSYGAARRMSARRASRHLDLATSAVGIRQRVASLGRYCPSGDVCHQDRECRFERRDRNPAAVRAQ